MTSAGSQRVFKFAAIKRKLTNSRFLISGSSVFGQNDVIELCRDVLKAAIGVNATNARFVRIWSVWVYLSMRRFVVDHARSEGESV